MKGAHTKQHQQHPLIKAKMAIFLVHMPLRFFIPSYVQAFLYRTSNKPEVMHV